MKFHLKTFVLSLSFTAVAPMLVDGPAMAEDRIAGSAGRVESTTSWAVKLIAFSIDDSRTCLSLTRATARILTNNCTRPIAVRSCVLLDATRMPASSLKCGKFLDGSYEILADLEGLTPKAGGQVFGSYANARHFPTGLRESDIKTEYFIVYTNYCENQSVHGRLLPNIVVKDGEAKVASVEQRSNPFPTGVRACNL